MTTESRTIKARTIKVSGVKIDAEVDEKLRKRAQGTKISGFRKGKAPVAVLKSKYYIPDLTAALSKAASSKLYDEYPDLAYASTPEFVNYEKKGDAYLVELRFEVWPDCKIQNLKKIKVKAPVLAIEDAEVQREKKRVIEKFPYWYEVSDSAQGGNDAVHKDHAGLILTSPSEKAVSAEKNTLTDVSGNKVVELNDRVVVDYQGKYRGTGFRGGTGVDETVTVEIDKYLPDFYTGLLGMSAGERRILQVRMPKQFRDKRVADKTVEFEVLVKRIMRASSPEMTPEYFKSIGFKASNEAEFEAELRSLMEREAASRIEDLTYGSAVNELARLNEVELPQTPILEQMSSMLTQAGVKSVATVPEAQLKEIRAQAELAVRKSFIVRKLLEANDLLEVKPEELQRYTEQKLQLVTENTNTQRQGDGANDEISKEARAQASKVLENERERSRYLNLALRDRFLELVRSRCKLQEEAMSFSEIMSLK